VTFKLQLTGGMARYNWGINGQLFDMAQPGALRYLMKHGQPVRVIFDNSTTMYHPRRRHDGRAWLPGLTQTDERSAATRSSRCGHHGNLEVDKRARGVLRPSMPLSRLAVVLVVHIRGSPVGLAAQKTCLEAGP
jgi:hypothetical protein